MEEINGENEAPGQEVPDSKDSAYEPSTLCAFHAIDTPGFGSSDFNVMMLSWNQFVSLMRAEFIFFPQAYIHMGLVPDLWDTWMLKCIGWCHVCTQPRHLFM